MATVSDMLDRIRSLEELEGFSETLFHPPPGVKVKPYTDEDQRRIARMKIEFQRNER